MANEFDFKYTINKEITTLGENSTYSNKLSIVSWNNYQSKFDLRRWKADENGNFRPTKGIALNIDEMEKLKKVLNSIENFSDYMAEFGGSDEI